MSRIFVDSSLTNTFTGIWYFVICSYTTKYTNNIKSYSFSFMKY